MAIKNIDQLCLYTYLKPVSIEGRTRQPSFPMLVLMDGGALIAAIKNGFGDAWPVDNVHALEG